MAIGKRARIRIRYAIKKAMGCIPVMVAVSYGDPRSYHFDPENSSRHNSYLDYLDFLEEQRFEAVRAIEEMVAFISETTIICSPEREPMGRCHDYEARERDDRRERARHDWLKSLRTRRHYAGRKPRSIRELNLLSA